MYCYSHGTRRRNRSEWSDNLAMEQITLYVSSNNTFVFHNKEECEHYDSLCPIDYSNLFLKVEDIRFVLLESNIDSESQTIKAMFQSTQSFASEIMCSNHDELWRITYDYKYQTATFEKKSAQTDSVYADIDFKSLNPEGWFPYWDNQYIDCHACKIEEFTLEAFLSYVKESFINYYTAFGCLEMLNQNETERKADINGLYGFLAVKESKYLHRIEYLKNKKEELCTEGNKKDAQYGIITSLLDRTHALLELIRDIENFI